MGNKLKKQSLVHPYPCSQFFEERVLLAEVVEKVVGDLVEDKLV